VRETAAGLLACMRFRMLLVSVHAFLHATSMRVRRLAECAARARAGIRARVRESEGIRALQRAPRVCCCAPREGQWVRVSISGILTAPTAL